MSEKKMSKRLSINNLRFTLQRSSSVGGDSSASHSESPKKGGFSLKKSLSKSSDKSRSATISDISAPIVSETRKNQRLLNSAESVNNRSYSFSKSLSPTMGSSLSVKEEQIESIFESVDKEVNSIDGNNNNSNCNNVNSNECDPTFNNDLQSNQEEEREDEIEREEIQKDENSNNIEDGNYGGGDDGDQNNDDDNNDNDNQPPHNNNNDGEGEETKTEDEIVNNSNNSEQKESFFDDSNVNYEMDMWGVPDNEKSITYNDAGDFNIKSATLGKLVEKLSSCEPKNQIQHTDYMCVFFMTYRSYADPVDIFNRLVKRFRGPTDIPPGVHITEVVPNIYLIRKSVCIALVHWFTKHYRDFCNNAKLLQGLQEFITEAAKIDEDNKDKIVNYLDKMVQKKVNKGTYTSLFASDIMIDKSNCPDPILPKDLNSATFMTIDELEIARQLTIGEYHIYAEIQPVELQDLAWSKAHLKERAPNVLEMIERFNKFSNRFSTLIVTQQKLKDRKKVIEKLIKVAEYLFQFNSFNMTMAIMSGFSNSAIFRMKHSFEGLSKKATDTLEHLNQVLSSNQSYKVYREVTGGIIPPAIPFLGVYLSDLTFVDEGNPNKIGGLHNFRKKQLEYDVIVQVLKFQTMSYSFKMVPKITSILNSMPTLKENEMYQTSLQNEPRNAKKKELK